MNAGQFARRLALIEHDARRSRHYKSNALKSLMREAGAVLMIFGGRITGWRLPNGQVVCRKRRYRTEEDARLWLVEITRNPMTKKIPTRAYLCSFCNGWHLTSQDRDAEIMH